MPKNRNFRLRPKADRDLENIYQYSVQEFGRTRAAQYIRDLDAAFHTLTDEPTLGRDDHSVRSGLLSYRVVSHVIFFKTTVDGIIILRVLHKSMDYKRHL